MSEPQCIDPLPPNIEKLTVDTHMLFEDDSGFYSFADMHIEIRCWLSDIKNAKMRTCPRLKVVELTQPVEMGDHESSLQGLRGLYDNTDTELHIRDTEFPCICCEDYRYHADHVNVS